MSVPLKYRVSRAIIYHCYGSVEDVPSNMTIPVIPSIATIRAFQSDLPIYVLDVSADHIHRNWSHFPKTLNFEVIRTSDAGMYQGHKYRKLLARTKLIYDFANTTVHDEFVFMDSDIAWFGDPGDLPPISNFHGLPGNSGIYMWRRDSVDARKFFDLWLKCTDKVATDRAFAERVAEIYKFRVIQDEAVYCYITRMCPKMLTVLPLRFNFIPNKLNLKPTYNVHLVHGRFGNDRGLIFGFTKELSDTLDRVLTPRQRFRIFKGRDQGIPKMTLGDFLQLHVLEPEESPIKVSQG